MDALDSLAKMLSYQGYPGDFYLRVEKQQNPCNPYSYRGTIVYQQGQQGRIRRHVADVVKMSNRGLKLDEWYCLTDIIAMVDRGRQVNGSSGAVCMQAKIKGIGCIVYMTACPASP